ncbi:PAS domain-containing protein, partial [Cyathus striatus]
IYNGAPTLAPGGGAEVLPMGMLNDSSWFSHNGFTPHFFASKETSPSSPDSQTQQQTQQYTSSTTSAPFEFDSYTAPVNSLPPVQQLIPPNPAELSLFMSSSAAPPMHQGLLAATAAASTGAPSPLGLPVYSASGFDLLSILSRVASRPNPRVQLGPVDLTCSFVVVDVRRHDHPVVYCSPTFCRLTGYSENEVIGRNCRFLQSPGGHVQKGEVRRFTSMEAIAHLKKSLSADKECQTSIVNYRKDGQAFINLVTVIPVTGGVSGSPHEESDVVYHVGFQVDLTEQPNAILEKLRDGSYAMNYSTSQAALGGAVVATKDRKSHSAPTAVMAKELKRLLSSSGFVKSIPISTSTTNPMPLSSAASPESNELPIGGGPNQTLHLLLLEACPDFIHVVSLKGNFLYVAPSVRRVLGYEPDEMVGKSISDFSHPEDVVPLMRELKESSATGMAATTPGAEGGPMQVQTAPRSVDMLFRARSKAGTYVWVECRGRLHVEPGKGRKAIILSGRAKEMPNLTWEAVRMGGGLTKSVRASRLTDENGDEAISDLASEFWGMISGGGKINGTATFFMLGEAVQDVLGWLPGDLVGRLVSTILVDDTGLEDEISLMGLHIGTQEVSRPRQIRCRLRRKDGSVADVLFVVYMPIHDPLAKVSSRSPEGISPAPFIFQVKLFDAVSSPGTSHMTSSLSSAISLTPPVSLAHPLSANVFEELEISRGSSWQYELQQLKYANQRLLDEIALLES